jgi:hypothetical protein
MPINASWHRANPMPKNATLDERVVWHLAHARACGCRAIPATVRRELTRRGLAALAAPTRTRPRLPPVPRAGRKPARTRTKSLGRRARTV